MATFKLSPTLILGLGGTGKDVLLRIRKMFFERYGKNPFGGIGFPVIGYLAIDTDDQKLDGVAGEPLTPFVARNIRLNTEGDAPEVVVCDIKSQDFDNYFNGGSQSYPHIFEWMPPDMNKYGSSAVVQGAGQNRLFGRLAFFHHYNSIRSALKKKLLQIQNYAIRPELLPMWLPEGARAEDVNPKQVEVVIVYSLAGGTGAGMFLDAAMLVRDVLNELDLGTSILIHYLVMPEVMTGPGGVLANQVEMKKKVEENAFAALREMEYFALRREGLFDLSIPPSPTAQERGPGQMPLFEVRWERDRPTKIYNPPWDICYLVGGSNEPLAGQQLPLAEVCQMIAEQIGLYFDPGDFGERMRSNRSNDVAKTIDVMAQKVYGEDGVELFSRYVSRRFSLFGLAQLNFDRTRMKRAAAHKLAALFLKVWWKRTTGLLPNEYESKALSDLGTDDARELPTVTPHGQQSPMSLAVLPVGRALLRTAAGSTSHMGEVVNERHKSIRAALETAPDSLRIEIELREWIAENRAATAPPARGERLAASAIPNVIRQNREELTKTAQNRLDDLFHYRLSQWGIPDTIRLLQSYQEILDERVEEAAEYRMASNAGPTAWEARLADAKKVPGYLKRMAARAELQRAADAVRKQIAGWYKEAIAADIFQFFQDTAKRVRRDGTGASYSASLRSFDAKLPRVEEYLHARFQELSRPEQSRIDTRGNPEVEKPTSGRTTSLLHKQTEEEYEKRIAKTLHAVDGRIDSLDWVQIEGALLAELGKSPNSRLANSTSLADLILQFFPVTGTPAASDADFDDLARELATCCEALLPRFAEDITARDEFFTQPDTETPLRNLRTYSAPLMRKNKDVLTTRDVDTDPRQMLGMAGQQTVPGGRFLDMLRRSGEKDSLSLTGLESLDLKSDAIVLYREKVGIPLCYSASLGELGDRYDHTRRASELHIHADFFRGKLPEIRHIDQAKQTRMAHCLESAVVGIVVGQILFDPGRNTFSMVYKEFTSQLGTHLEEVVRNLTGDADRARVLESSVDRWLTESGAAAEGRPLATLWAALRWFYEELRHRVEILLNNQQSRGRYEHPLLSFVRDRMLPRVRSRLSRTTGGLALIAKLEEITQRMYEPQTRPDERADLWRQWQEMARDRLGAFAPINDRDLPIPVLALSSQRPAS